MKIYLTAAGILIWACLVIMGADFVNPNSYISPVEDVRTFLVALKQILISKNYELDIIKRKNGEDPLDPCTTENTLASLSFDMEDVKNELLALTEGNYLETMHDDKTPTYPPFWVFGKDVHKQTVYIKVKIRNKLANKVFCVSFHFPRHPLKTGPYTS